MDKVVVTFEAPGDIPAILPQSTSAPMILNVLMKLLDGAEVWFAQAEARFAIRNISKTNFYQCSRHSSTGPRPAFRPHLSSSSCGSLRETLKDRLITLYSLKYNQCFEALVSLHLTGDHGDFFYLMKRMLVLLPDDYKTDFILCGLFLCSSRRPVLFAPGKGFESSSFGPDS